MRASTLWRVDGALLALHAAGAIAAWLSLPPRVPIHFGFSGTSDAWARTSVISWYGPLAISIALSWFIHALTMKGPDDIWNVPEKRRFLELPPERREPVRELLRASGAASAISATVLFLALQGGIYLAASGAADGLPWYVQGVMLGAVAGLLLGMIPWSRAVRRAVLEASPSE